MARDPSNPTPVQPGVCAILAVFLFIGTFILNIIRIKIPKGNRENIYIKRQPSQSLFNACCNLANFAAINACIILTVSTPSFEKRKCLLYSEYLALSLVYNDILSIHSSIQCLCYSKNNDQVIHKNDLFIQTSLYSGGFLSQLQWPVLSP